MESVTIKILSREYQVYCPGDQANKLNLAASYLDEKMTQINNKGKIISFEAMLITAAINLADEVISKNSQNNYYESNFNNNLKLLQNKLNAVLENKLGSNKLNLEYNNIED